MTKEERKERISALAKQIQADRAKQYKRAEPVDIFQGLPLEVDMEPEQIIALGRTRPGTQFRVDEMPELEGVVISVTPGSVKVVINGHEDRITPHMRVRVLASDGVTPLRVVASGGHIARQAAIGNGKDRYGNKLGSGAARLNAAVTNEYQTIKQIAAKAGVKEDYAYGHLQGYSKTSKYGPQRFERSGDNYKLKEE